MKKSLIIGTILFFGLCVSFYFGIYLDNEELKEKAKGDFIAKYPDYEFVNCFIGEGDLVVSYVHIKFKKSRNEKIEEEVWQYWDTENGWIHRDKYLDLPLDKR